MAGLRFPVIVYQDGTEQPPDGENVCYVLAKNGTYIIKKLGLVEAMVKVPSVPTLENAVPYADMDVSKIPLDEFAYVLNFFIAVYKKYKTEAVVILFYSIESQEWLAFAPDQIVGHSSVRYTDGLQFDGWLKAGTIHSHCDFGASHSGGDDHDEQFFDGIHITVGNVNREHPSISVSIVVNGQRFKKDADEYLDLVTEKSFSTECVVTSQEPIFEDQIVPNTSIAAQLKSTGNSHGRWKSGWQRAFGGGSSNSGGNKIQQAGHRGGSKVVKRFKGTKTVKRVVKSIHHGIILHFDEGETLEDYPFPPEWLERVVKPAPVMSKRAGHMITPHDIGESRAEEDGAGDLSQFFSDGFDPEAEFVFGENTGVEMEED